MPPLAEIGCDAIVGDRLADQRCPLLDDQRLRVIAPTVWVECRTASPGEREGRRDLLPGRRPGDRSYQWSTPTTMPATPRRTRAKNRLGRRPSSSRAGAASGRTTTGSRSMRRPATQSEESRPSRQTP